LLLEALHDRAEVALEDVVGEHDAAAIAGDEPLRQAERLCDSALALLVRVEEAVYPVVVAVAEQSEELARVRSAGDEHQLLDASFHQRLDRVGHHRPVVQGQQVLVRDAGERGEPAARAARQDHAFHT